MGSAHCGGLGALIGSDLAPHLMSPGAAARPRQPLDAADLPAGARAALNEACGRQGLDHVLVVLATARPVGRLHRRCVYTPPCVLGVGERAAGLWVEALPVPGVRAIVPVGELAVIELQAEGTDSRLTLRGRRCSVSVRSNRAADPLASGRAAAPPGRGRAFPCPRCARGQRVHSAGVARRVLRSAGMDLRVELGANLPGSPPPVSAARADIG